MQARPAKLPMQTLRPMTEAEFAGWLPATIAEYAAQKVESGSWAAEESPERSTKEYADLLPQGLASPDQHLNAICNAAGERVGWLWFSVTQRFGKRVAYVYDLSVLPEHQRQGHARRALQALEPRVQALGLAGVALHVFGHNRAARALYAELGYEPTNLNLFKPVADAPPSV